MPNNTLLICDDDPEILDFYRKLFSPSKAPEFDILGSQVSTRPPDLACLTFSDPRELIKEYERTVKSGDHHPLCIMDMRMPVLSGLAAAIQLRKIDPEINVVICSAFSDVSLPEIRSTLQQEVFFVRKPFVPEEFSLLIHSLVGHWNTQRELESARADLAAQCEKLAMVIEGTRVGTWDWMIPSGQVEFNERWAEIVGYELRELEPTDIGTWARLCHPDDLARSNGLLEKVFARELEYYDFECRMLHKNGSWVWVWDRGKVSEWSPDGKPLRMSGTHSDITEKRLTAEIKSRLISMASHEFRTPLASIRLAADLLSSRREMMDEATVQRTLQSITKTTDYMVGIVSDVLALGSIGSNPQADPLSEIPLEDFLRQTVEEFRAASLNPREITFECSSSPVSCTGIPSLLKRAVTNLLDNAAKYSPEGTPVVLRLQREKASAVIQIEDQGRGIPEADLPSLYEPFYRASNTAGIAGTGLGLAIVAEALQRMDGKIAIVSRDGGGTIFTIRLPLAA